MRVTEHNNFETVRESINRSKGRMDALQRQSSTLKKINTPSDNPIGSSKVLEIRTDKVNNDQFQMNAKLAETFLANTDHALSELADIVVRAKEIALGQSSRVSSNDDTRLGVAEEVTQLFKQAVATANRRIGDRYLFGGYKTQTPPVSPEGDYLGDQGEMMVEIAREVYLATNVPGASAFNSRPESLRLPQAPGQAGAEDRALAGEQAQPERENVNLFDQLQALRISLLTGDLEGIRGTLEKFDDLHGSITATRTKVGSRLMGLHNTSQALERHNVTNAQLSSVLEDADMAQVVSDLAKEETVFRSSLASSQRLIQPTLMDFIK